MIYRFIDPTRLNFCHCDFVFVDDKTREEFQSWMHAFPHLR